MIQILNKNFLISRQLILMIAKKFRNIEYRRYIYFLEVSKKIKFTIFCCSAGKGFQETFLYSSSCLTFDQPVFFMTHLMIHSFTNLLLLSSQFLLDGHPLLASEKQFIRRCSREVINKFTRRLRTPSTSSYSNDGMKANH